MWTLSECWNEWHVITGVCMRGAKEQLFFSSFLSLSEIMRGEESIFPIGRSTRTNKKIPLVFFLSPFLSLWSQLSVGMFCWVWTSITRCMSWDLTRDQEIHWSQSSSTTTAKGEGKERLPRCCWHCCCLFDVNSLFFVEPAVCLDRRVVPLFSFKPPACRTSRVEQRGENERHVLMIVCLAEGERENSILESWDQIARTVPGRRSLSIWRLRERWREILSLWSPDISLTSSFWKDEPRRHPLSRLFFFF